LVLRSIAMRLLCSAVLGVGILIVPGSSALAANSAAFQDATGENPGGVDITTVLVSNDVAGLLTFRISVPAHPAFTADMRVIVWFDSDSNRDTGVTEGDFAGTDYYILWDREGARLFRCNGSSCTNGTPQVTLGSSYRRGATLTINADEIKAKRFKFAVYAAAGIEYDPVTRRGDLSNATVDWGPERGRFWSYSVGAGPSRLLVRSFSTAPARPKAGERLSVHLAATRDDTGALLSNGRVTCVARIGAKPLKPRSQSFSGRRATCVFAIPPAAKGQTLRGSIAVAFEGRRVKKSFSRRIG
jgi:hypothetical protein